MKRFILLAALLTACQPEAESIQAPSAPAAAVTKAEIKPKPEVKAGVVRLRLNAPVSEPLACIIPISVENGLEASTRVTMIAFKLTGPGNDGTGNMFAPAASAGEISEARVVVEGQSCAAFNVIHIPEIRCTSDEQSCTDKIELIDGKALRFSREG